jgi:hypothetical protein
MSPLGALEAFGKATLDAGKVAAGVIGEVAATVDVIEERARRAHRALGSQSTDEADRGYLGPRKVQSSRRRRKHIGRWREGFTCPAIPVPPPLCRRRTA